MTDSDTIHIEMADSSLGVVLVALTENGVRAVQIGDDAKALRREFDARFAACTAGEDSRLARRATRAVIACIESRTDAPSVPLDIQGTPFQKKVWEQLREIPRGSTITYGELARRIGRPNAVRAVAHACAGNPIAVLIPCHRVVRSDGSLAGYRWGIDRKRELLAREARQTAAAKPPAYDIAARQS